MTRENMGDTGAYRPNAWQPLSLRYARRVGRSQATLVLTGKLQASIRMSINGDSSVDLHSESPYADTHQYGRGNIPRRGFFPVDEDGHLAPLAEKQITQVANDELEKIVQGSGSFLIP